MHPIVTLVLSAAAGFVLGALYFAGLRLTTLALTRARRPALLMIASLIGRMALLLAGIWLVGAGDWRRILAATIGVVAARAFVLDSVHRGAKEANA